MKKWLTASLILVVLMIITVTVSAGTSFKDKAKGSPKFECKAMADQNKDGICDNYSTSNCKHAEGCNAGVLDNKDGKKCSGECKDSKKCAGECKDSKKCAGECKDSKKCAGECKDSTKCSGECKKATGEKKCSGECKKTTEEKKCSGECGHKDTGCAAKQSAATSSCCSNKK
jgi:hypothetical protein